MMYDRLVPGVLNPRVWHCPTGQLIEHYRQNCRAVHVDLGSGTGFFLEQIVGDREFDRLVLVDARSSCLRHAARRLAPNHPELVQLDVTRRDPPPGIPVDAADSVAASYLIHCLPEGIGSADLLTREAARLTGQHGVFFGSTLLPGPAQERFLSRWCTSLFNRAGIFGNREDSRERLAELLERHFSNVRIELAGCAALFRADNRPATG